MINGKKPLPGSISRRAQSSVLSRCVILCIMSRLNLTLDNDTETQLEGYARKLGKPRARLARELLREGLSRRAAQDRRRQLAEDYAADREDVEELLGELEGLQNDLLGEEDA